jgi:hypothetical protein
MRKLVIAAVTGVVIAGGATIALAAAWPNVTVKPLVSSTKAGTPSHPKGVHLTTLFNWQTLGSASQPIVTSFFVEFPKGSLYNGSKYPTCSLSTLNRKGPAGCSRSSIMGSGTGTAYADTTITHPQITVVNGGASTIYFYTVLNNPARVQEPVIGHIKRISGKFAYQLTSTVPNNLRIVAGVPIELTSLKVSAGNGTYLSTIGCSGGSWPFFVKTNYENPNDGSTGSATFSSSVHCTK